MSEYVEFFKSLKDIIVNSIQSLPAEISTLVITGVTLILAFFIYRFLR